MRTIHYTVDMQAMRETTHIYKSGLISAIQMSMKESKEILLLALTLLMNTYHSHLLLRFQILPHYYSIYTLFNSPIHTFSGHKSKSSLRSASLTHYFETPDDEERHFPPLTDNLYNNLLIFSRQSEEESSAECPSFTSLALSYSSPTLFISSMPILSICRSKSSPRPPPLTLSLDTPENNSLTAWCRYGS